ncbi:hypothetical protein [Cochleicola gelatinilyticus]|uniref:Selenophosphate synthetase n=1 Tax=Cochleicola gelatinilyticus TaxID=1763537 RepID=A0A167F417_9FLAO|nr:hypothetical protein [Cochleicola gelatinilyticus]OAB76170.1 hypothetical protein ULVI_14040 [Cochleicola gelatinilyticus]
MRVILTLFLLTIFILSCKNDRSTRTNNDTELTAELEQDKTFSTAEMIANKNGFENWDNISEIQFTFNVDRGVNHSERSWIWKPQTNDVTMMTATDTVNYNRTSMDSITMKSDAAFINDKYWLLAPFNLAWDEGTTFSEKENVVAPISKDTLNQLTVVYGNQGGYTPGDAYDFYFGKDFIIKEWVFRQKNASEPSMITTWEDYETFEGIEIAKMHKDPTGDFKLYFTNIKVK